jgi:hypothetical protein
MLLLREPAVATRHGGARYILTALSTSKNDRAPRRVLLFHNRLSRDFAKSRTDEVTPEFAKGVVDPLTRLQFHTRARQPLV